MAQTSFRNIRVADEMGVADADGYHLHFEARYSAGEVEGEPRRCVVRIAGRAHDVALALDADPEVDVWTGTVESP